ncbi:hypothetical protein MJO28_012576 [Puccinia striiformis f. sp. tritici]|uniref:Uncharacterized protein n=1 Tax=Puccinia striiformis f. sp. tritici TaxID=168172 RepID=A0ACC0E0A2_9BASI|nr:hypothetical protein MJO28_012576 [Puccinia striiformis f. sp. tritici]
MNNLTFDSSFPKFSGPDFLRFCGKFTVYTEASVFRSYSATTTEAVVSGSWYGGKDICHVSLRGEVNAANLFHIGSTYEIAGDVEGSNAYFMPILIWRTGDERITRLGTQMRDRSPMRFSGVGTILSWQRFAINRFNKEDLIQVQVFHTNALALNGGIVVRLLLGWDYCHVDRDCKAFIGSRIAYIGLFEGSDRNDGSAIVQGYKAVINFSPSWLDRNALENGVNLSDDFN